jgi:hypothetical protein
VGRRRRLCWLGDRAASEGLHGSRNKKLIDVLVWHLDWGESFETIVKAARASGAPLEMLPCVATRPDLFGHLTFEWSAFRSLSTDRPIGLAMGPIPWSSIDRFAGRYDIAGDDFDRFSELIQAMDAAFRDYHERQTADAKR